MTQKEFDYPTNWSIKTFDCDFADQDQCLDSSAFTSFLSEMGVGRGSITSIQAVTQIYMPVGARYGDWIRGGGESFYKILRIGSQYCEPELLAMKAIVSTGGEAVIKDKALAEAAILSRLHHLGCAPRVYCVAGATVYKEFLTADRQVPANSEASIERLVKVMSQNGIMLPTGRLPQVIFHKGMPYLIDGGLGDLDFRP